MRTLVCNWDRAGTRRWRRRRYLMLGVLVPLLLGVGGWPTVDNGIAASQSASLGAPPPEWDANARGWPSHNYDLANTRATTQSPINSHNVSRLKVKWRFPLEGDSFFGSFASNPIVLNGTVYIQELNSDVVAIDKDNGKVKWRRSFDRASPGPNGLAYGWGRLYGMTPLGVFALDPKTGRTLWSRELTTPDHGGVDIAPQLYDNTVVVSTVPLNVNYLGEQPGVAGIVWALDAGTGATRWEFNTVKDGDLWGNPELNFGGGLWYPPAVDRQGRVFIAVANPGPFPGTPEFPNGSSRPGPNLYTNSLVALDGRTGHVLWYRQALPHDLRDHDLQISPIITHLPIGGQQTEVVITAGKMGKVFAYRADDGEPLWEVSVGRHENDTGPLPDEFVTVYPGALGGVETPMALADGRLFVTWVDWGRPFSSTESIFDPSTLGSGRGGLAAVDPTTGQVLWTRGLPQMPLGAATVVNDVVFTSVYSGEIYAYDVKTGTTLWRDRARAGINSFPAVAGDMLLVGAGVGPAPWSGPPEIFPDPLVKELVAYRMTD